MKYFFIFLLFLVTKVNSQSCLDCSFHWRQISGPVQSTIKNPDSVSTEVTGLNQVGIYQFEFSVTNVFGTVRDTCSVTVIKGALGITEDSVYHFTRPEIKKLSIKAIVRASEILVEVKSPKGQRITAFLYDLTGRKLAQSDFNVMKGVNNIRLPKPRIDGVYILQFVTYFGNPVIQKIFI